MSIIDKNRKKGVWWGCRHSQIGLLVEIEDPVPEVMHFGQNQSVFDVVGGL